MLDTVVMSGDDVCCSVVFGTLVGVFVFSVMWSECYVWSTLLYGCETWTISVAMQKKIDAFETWLYRRMLRISWKDMVTNEEVYRRMNIKQSLLVDESTIMMNQL